MINKPTIRFLLFVAVFVAVAVLPWWFSVLILIGLTIYYQFYLEILFFGFFFDIIYSTHFSFPYMGLSIATVFLIVVYFAKTYVRI